MTAEGNEHLSTVVVPTEVKTLKTEVVDGSKQQAEMEGSSTATEAFIYDVKRLKNVTRAWWAAWFDCRTGSQALFQLYIFFFLNLDWCGNLYHPALKTTLQQKVWIFYNSTPFSIRRTQYFFWLFCMFLFFVFSIKRNREFCPVFLNNKPPGEAPLSMTFSDLSKLSNLL